MKILILTFILICNVCFSQNTQFEKAYKMLIMSYYNDSVFQKKGSLLPLPDDIKNNNKTNIIYIKPNQKFSTKNNIEFLENDVQIIFKIDTSIKNSMNNVNLQLLSEKIIDTFYNKSKDYNFNLLGRLIINNIYVRKKYSPKSFNELFFEVIRSGTIYTDQSLELVHLIKINGVWQINGRRQL